MGAIGHSCPIRIKTFVERLVCVETDRRTGRRTRLDRLVQCCWSRIYMLYGVGNVPFTAVQTS